MRLIAALVLPLILQAALHAEALSIAPLAKALQDSTLTGDSPDEARAAVRALLLNQPEGEDELERFHDRLASLARHRETRLGRLFFRALETMPDVEQIPEAATRVELLLRRPLALDAQLRVHVSWQRVADEWKVARLDVGVLGAAAAPVSKAPPYFGTGLIPEFLLNAEELDLLVGRDPADRRAPEQQPFDFAAALESYLRTEPGVYGAVIERLQLAVAPRTEREARMDAMRPHLEAADVRKMELADADADKRDEFWRRMMRDLDFAATAPRPSAVPVRAGSSLRISAFDDMPAALAVTSVTRLRSGEIAPKVERRED